MKVLVATTWKPNDRKTLCAVRSLGARGVEVTVGGDRFAGGVFHSRFGKRRLLYPHPDVDMGKFVACLEEAISREKFDTVLPTCDFIVMALAMHRERLAARTALTIPDYETVMKTRDKLRTLEIAKALGLAIPVTYHVTPERSIKWIAEQLEYPCVLKPRQGLGAIGVIYPKSKAELIRIYHERRGDSNMVVKFEEPLIQEYIPGESNNVGALFNRGEPRAALTYRRLRMMPPNGGVGILTLTTKNRAVQAQGLELLKAISWHGPAMVEFRTDSRTGVPKLMEINGWLWGVLDLALGAGIDFPWLTCRMAVEGDIEPVFNYKVGMRCRYPMPDGLIYAYKTRRLRALWDFFGWQRNMISDAWITDPAPTIVETWQFAREVAERRMGNGNGRG